MDPGLLRPRVVRSKTGETFKCMKQRIVYRICLWRKSLFSENAARTADPAGRHRAVAKNAIVNKDKLRHIELYDGRYTAR